MDYFKILASLILCLLIITGPTFGQDKKAPPPPSGFSANQGIAKNSKAPNFEYLSLNEKEIELNDYRGQYVLIDFWGTWCKPCLEEISYLKKAYSRYSDKIKFISVAVHDSKQAVSDFMQKNDIKWTQIVLASDSENPAEIIEDYNVRLYPSVYIIDPDGVIQNGAENKKEQDKLSEDQLLKTLDKVYKLYSK